MQLRVREPSSSTDSVKLLLSDRADFAILDIHDLAIARERGIPIVGVAPIVERPLAAVIAADPNAVRSPADLAGKTVGVTGLPSDDAVLDPVLITMVARILVRRQRRCNQFILDSGDKLLSSRDAASS